MKGCLIFQAKCASRRLRLIARHYSTEVSIADAESSTKSEPNSSNDLSSNHEDPHLGTTAKTTNLREGVKNGGVQSNKRADLPLSPLMDPAFLAARKKHHAPKPRPSGDLTDFQILLARNPYALALATPIRLCCVSLISLPNFFLQDFTLMENPHTGVPWHIPRSLSSKQKPSADHNVNNDEDIHKRLPAATPSIGPSIYVAMRQPLLQSFFAPKSGNAGIYQKFGAHNRSRSVWRSDMDSLILELMRKQIVSNLIHLSRSAKGYLVTCSGWEDATWKSQAGAVLYMGLKVPEGVELEEQDDKIPVDFDVLRVGKEGKKVIPVYNLRSMLGKLWIEKLRQESRFIENNILALKHKNMTKELQMKLWRLQGYVATQGNNE